MKETPTKLWITKYALTKGIVEAEGRFGDSGEWAHTERFRHTSFRRGESAHTTRADAVAKANQMRILKIASLEKQIEKLRKLKFE